MHHIRPNKDFWKPRRHSDREKPTKGEWKPTFGSSASSIYIIKVWKPTFGSLQDPRSLPLAKVRWKPTFAASKIFQASKPTFGTMEAHQRRMEASQTGKAHLHSGSKPTFGRTSGSLQDLSKPRSLEAFSGCKGRIEAHQRKKLKEYLQKYAEKPLFKGISRKVPCIYIDICRLATNVRGMQCGGGHEADYEASFFDLRYLARLRIVKKAVGLSTAHETAQRPSKSAFRAVKMRQPLALCSYLCIRKLAYHYGKAISLQNDTIIKYMQLICSIIGVSLGDLTFQVLKH